MALCPPGRARQDLQTALRSQPRSKRRNAPKFADGGYYGLDKMLGPGQLANYEEQEEDFLRRTNTYDMDSDEEASSGDDDELENFDGVMQQVQADSPIEDNEYYLNLREPLFTPVGQDPAVSSPNGASVNTATAGKLPFNYRKLKFFDVIKASDRAVARKYLRDQQRNILKREGMWLSKHLRRVQRLERRRILEEKGSNTDALEKFDEDNDSAQQEEELCGSNSGLSTFPFPMTPSISAALLLESISLNKIESVEGMSKCYDGIVAAGVVLLDAEDNRQSNAPLDEDQKARLSRSEVMAALAPLLITYLDQASGEAILGLARLRNMCGTARYRRRFVQRVAPGLIRPQRSAMWCLKHQNDMEPILAAAELIFDTSEGIFRKGWFERGKLLLADSKRAETLNNAADQLRRLSTTETDVPTLGLVGHGSHRRRTNKLMVGATPTKDGATGPGSNEPLAEWEVIAVDRQIRISISNIISKDWSRVSLPTRELDIIRGAPRRSNASNAGAATRRAQPSVSMSFSADASPKATQSPHSPIRKTEPRSPASSVGSRPVARSPTTVPPESIESVFGPSFSTQPPSSVVTAPSLSPSAEERPPSPTPPKTPPPPSKNRVFEEEATARSPFTSPAAPAPKLQRPEELPTLTLDTKTPPRSPHAASKPLLSPPRSGSKTPPLTRVSPLPFSDKQNTTASPGGERSQAPLSPSITTTASDIASYRVGSTGTAASPVNSGASPKASYRMLTSTAAERKRTVAACRALRAQISRFEEAFVQLHGRPPKGAAERAPLATTYAQYREWKRAIRADAACRIQALFRGASTRWMLLRSNNPRMARVVMTRAGRSGFGGASGKFIGQENARENILSNLSIPVEIGGNDAGRSVGLTPMTGSMGAVPASYSDNDSGLAPNWSSTLPRRRSGSSENEGFARRGSPSPQVPSPSGMSTGSSTSFSSELNGMSMSDLSARKRELKQQLKQYDMKFARKHGRMPVKAEKEPIRHLYENYNALKTQINAMEQDSQSSGGIQHVVGGVQGQQRTPSPPGHIASSSEGRRGDELLSNNYSPSLVSSGGSKSRKSIKSPSEPLSAGTPPSVATTPQDMAGLKVEKAKLHQMLRSYEKDFFKDHKRQVSSFADIKPVASQYRRYKEIKKAIANLQHSGEK